MLTASAVDRLSPTQRLGEVAAILAAGILRLRHKLGAVPATVEQVRLDFLPERSVSADRLRPRRTAP